MQTRDQRLAALTFAQVSAVREKPEGTQKKYGTIVHRMPALVRSAGLAAALSFVKSRGNPGSELVLSHLATAVLALPATSSEAAHLRDVASTGTLLAECISAGLPNYMLLTDRTLQALAWMRRWVKSELRIEASDDVDSEEGAHAAA